MCFREIHRNVVRQREAISHNLVEIADGIGEGLVHVVQRSPFY